MENYLQQVKRAKQGDTEAFAELYGEIYENMYRFALYTLRHTADAEDVVSEAVVDAFASIGKLRTEEAFHSWIFRILTNKCKDKLREYCRKTVELEEVTEQAGYREGPEEAAITRKLFFELADEERLIIGMHLFCGYKTREIAEILHMNENTVRSKESRGLKKMAGKMDVGCGESRGLEKMTGKMETDARENRGWKKRTGEMKAGLKEKRNLKKLAEKTDVGCEESRGLKRAVGEMGTDSMESRSGKKMEVRS